ncbi:AcrR family transcriptional regulator [Mumia flava]|uniref:AcrR family transcriptional regulator n=1 Tax=Mumia flava TaxID=1348852 RepID=A0A0B2B6U3_9ACTN|nr:TetR/AcrR family transcriptional regulator [Mumia flava]PJJ57712.1 AcrR family transcriptional regulator [Mumia flava]
MPRRTKAESEATASTVLTAARDLFAADGYADVGLEQVAAAAGVTRGAVYHHYGSKQRLFAAVLERAHSDVAGAVADSAERARTASGDAWDGFEAGCRAFLEVSSSAPTRRILLIDGPAVVGWDAWREYDAAASGRSLEQGLRELAELDRLATVPRAATAALLSGAMNEAALWIASRPAPRRRQALEEAWSTLRVLLTGLRAGPR